ncbi:MAG: flagellar biosynthetic protein FliQ [Pseudomonadota bacterium]
MNAQLPGALLREGFVVLASVGGPYVGALLVVGLAIGIFQAATQINDPAVGFLPRLTAGIVLASVLGRWSIERLAQFLSSAIHRMAERL